MRKPIILICLLAFATGAFAQSPQLLRDIYPGIDSTAGLSTTTIAPIGDTLFLSTANAWDNHQLWMHDGSPAGGRALKCILPGFGSDCLDFIRWGAKVYFLANNVNSYSLWETDGTVNGSQEIVAFPANMMFPQMHLLGNQLLIFALGAGSQSELWISDGTAIGTSNLVVFSNHVNQNEITLFGNALYFTVGTELWKTDGTALGTDLVVDLHAFSPDNVENLTVFDGKLWFSAIDATHGRELWSTDGTILGTTMFDDYNPSSDDGVVSMTGFSRNMFAAGGRLYFVCADNGLTHGTEIRYTDGTLAGSAVVDYTPGPTGSQFDYWAASSNHLFFNELGTDKFCALMGNTVSILDSLGSTYLTGWRSAAAIGDTLVFIDGDSKVKVSDGTVSGTHALLPGTDLVGFSLVGDGKSAYFVGHPRFGTGPQIWKTDGTALGSVQYSPLYPTYHSSHPRGFIAGGQGVFFQAVDSLHGEEMWHTDGTTANTVLLQDFAPGTESLNLGDHIVWNDKLYFSAGSIFNEKDLWKSDGTPGGTVLLKNLSLPNAAGNPTDFLATDSALYFLSHSNSLGPELWRTDGTTAGTSLVLDPHFVSVNQILGRLGNSVLLGARSFSTQVNELWISDGTPGSATMLASFQNVIIAIKSYFNGKQYFVARGPGANPQIWTTEGTPATTVEFTQLNVSPTVFPDIWGELHGKLVFTMTGAATGKELWITDGTTSGTQLLRDIRLGSSGSDLQLIAIDDSLAYFQADDGQNGLELWRTDGTAAGTYLVADVNSGPEASRFRQPILHDHKLYCEAQTATMSKELLESDGTALGTVIYDLLPGPDPSDLQLQLYTDHGLLFEAGDHDHGANLYLLENGVLSMLPDPTGDPQGFSVTYALPYGSGIVISAKSTIYGHELFFLDSLQGFATQQVQAIKPGPGQQIMAYPVPAQTQVTLQVLGGAARIHAYELYDLAGHMLRASTVAPTADCVLDLSGIAAGMYTVRADLGKAGVGTVKVVKQ